MIPFPEPEVFEAILPAYMVNPWIPFVKFPDRGLCRIVAWTRNHKTELYKLTLREVTVGELGGME